MTQVTKTTLAYRYTFASDIEPENYNLSVGVARTPELDALATEYLNAKLALYAAVNPGRVLDELRLIFNGAVTVSEITADNATLYPIAP